MDEQNWRCHLPDGTYLQLTMAEIEVYKAWKKKYFAHQSEDAVGAQSTYGVSAKAVVAPSARREHAMGLGAANVNKAEDVPAEDKAVDDAKVAAAYDINFPDTLGRGMNDHHLHDEAKGDCIESKSDDSLSPPKPPVQIPTGPRKMTGQAHAATPPRSRRSFPRTAAVGIWSYNAAGELRVIYNLTPDAHAAHSAHPNSRIHSDSILTTSRLTDHHAESTIRRRGRPWRRQEADDNTMLGRDWPQTNQTHRSRR